ncbi:hypothetical protein ACHAW6_009876, partial [Cyclotella cf. meneghiniana]
MACFYGISDYCLWWSKKTINTFEGAPFRLNKFIICGHFSAITEAIRYTNKTPPQDFLDNFHEDHPKLANGKWAFPSPYESHSKTAELMLCMTEPIHHTGKIVCMDSGFCVTAGILALHQMGVYGQALIKKWGQYWPKHVPGVHMEMEFFERELGFGKTFVQTIENQKFLVHCHKDDRYVCKIMSTHGLMLPVDDHITYRYLNGEWESFKYCEPMSRHNRSKHW